MQTLPGFRDFFPSDCARRNYITGTWRRVARSFGFGEYDGPTLEPLDLYRKKNSGGEILGQLFSFTDKGEREVALRPEMTPTVARMLIAKAREYRKPIKWFSIAPFFRYEKQQSGRLREFLQLNCDLVGDASPAADAEMLALLIETLRAFGLTSEDVVVRVSDRRAWMDFLAAQGLKDEAQAREALSIVDKLEREPRETLEKKLSAIGLTLTAVEDFVKNARPEFFAQLRANLEARGLEEFCQLDLRIVRGRPSDLASATWCLGIYSKICPRPKRGWTRRLPRRSPSMSLWSLPTNRAAARRSGSFNCSARLACASIIRWVRTRSGANSRMPMLPARHLPWSSGRNGPP